MKNNSPKDSKSKLSTKANKEKVCKKPSSKNKVSKVKSPSTTIGAKKSVSKDKSGERIPETTHLVGKKAKKTSKKKSSTLEIKVKKTARPPTPSEPKQKPVDVSSAPVQSVQPVPPPVQKRAANLKVNLSAAIHELETKPAQPAAPKSTIKKTTAPPSPAISSRPRPSRHPQEGEARKDDKKTELTEPIPADERDIHGKKTTPVVSVAPPPPPLPKRSITINEFDTVRNFAIKIGVSPLEIIKKALAVGSVITINQKIDKITAELLAADYNCEVKFVSIHDDQETLRREQGLLSGKTQGNVPRPPVVTVMGHVDHGKTTLLDTIKHSNIVSSEHGGITQHIGAYKVKTPKGFVVFLDTPGHEAFTALRARGSKITDIVVLVVSAVDGVMPQTIEAINHARAAGAPIIVAINKIDLQGANPEKIKSELNQYKITPEEWGGDTIMVEISARNNINIDKLLDAIHLQAEMLELKCDPTAPAVGAVVEAKMDPRRGPLVTLLVRNGTLKLGNIFVAGSTYGKVRAMFDERGASIAVAEPSTPALVMGAAELPTPGDSFYTVKTDREAREITEKIKAAIKGARTLNPAALGGMPTLGIGETADKKDEKILRLILKADVAGSLEAIRDHIERIEHPEFKIQIIHSGVGQASESDINLAKTTGSVIICFNVKADSANQALADRYKVEIRSYRIVYELFSDIKKALEGLLEPKLEETIIGRAGVKKKFIVTKVGAVAGSYVLEGKIQRSAKARVLRDGVIVYDGKIGSLRRVKEDVSSVEKGYECGITLENFQDVKENDIIEVYSVEKVKRLL